MTKKKKKKKTSLFLNRKAIQRKTINNIRNEMLSGKKISVVFFNFLYSL